MMTKDGLIKYYKDKTLHRGTIILCTQTRAQKTGTNKFEIITPTRTWYLYEAEGNTIDGWIWDIC